MSAVKKTPASKKAAAKAAAEPVEDVHDALSQSEEEDEESLASVRTEPMKGAKGAKSAKGAKGPKEKKSDILADGRRLLAFAKFYEQFITPEIKKGTEVLDEKSIVQEFLDDEPNQLNENFERLKVSRPEYAAWYETEKAKQAKRQAKKTG